MTMSLYVGNLPYSADDESLKGIFAPYGEVTAARVMMDRETGRSRGFGFVEMGTEDARATAEALNGSSHADRSLRVNKAEKREKHY